MGFNNPMSLFLHLKDSQGLPSFEWPSSNQETMCQVSAGDPWSDLQQDGK